MRVFKFGGASVKNAESIHNVARIVQSHRVTPLVIVISAMGKMTNALESLHKEWREHNAVSKQLESIKKYHLDITNELFPALKLPVYGKLEELFGELAHLLDEDLRHYSYDHTYDLIIPYGELLSTIIVSEYLNSQQVPVQWVDSREIIQTNEIHRDAKIEWDLTEIRIRDCASRYLEDSCIITQGFIGATANGTPTTLGREGSDFSAAIWAYCLDAENVTIWKDVPGILNADPKLVKETVLFESLSYREAAEMTYYGATVIHPKTIKPLANKNIPLLVRSFENPEAGGTEIADRLKEKKVPTIIYKFNQVLVSFGIRDFTFINESNLSAILHILSQLNIRINLMQNSAISFSVCVDNQPEKIRELTSTLEHEFSISVQDTLELVTVKRYSHPLLEKIINEREVLLQQTFGNTTQLVIRK